MAKEHLKVILTIQCLRESYLFIELIGLVLELSCGQHQSPTSVWDKNTDFGSAYLLHQVGNYFIRQVKESFSAVLHHLRALTE